MILHGTRDAGGERVAVDPGRELFERIKRDGWALVEEWVRDREPETLHLEFKCKADARTPKIDPDDASRIAKALSGLANVEGGLLFLGIKAKELDGGLDRARGLCEISEVEKFAGSIDRRLVNFTDPLIAGLMTWPVVNPASPGAGVVAVCVPPSEGGPHRASNGSCEVNDRYYMRSAAGTHPMPHTLLADRFARSAPPRLAVQFRPYNHGQNASGLEIFLRNDGRGAARDPAVRFVNPPPELYWRMAGLGQNGFVTADNAPPAGTPGILFLPWGRPIILYPTMHLLVASVPFVSGVTVEALPLRLQGAAYAPNAAPMEFDEQVWADDTRDGSARP